MTGRALEVRDDGKVPEHHAAAVDERVLVARQIRLYIENSPGFYPLAVASGTALGAALLWPFVPEDHPKLVLWTTAIVVTLLMRLAAWGAFSRANRDDNTLGSWLKWFVIPHVCSVMVVGADPIFFLPTSSGHDLEILFNPDFARLHGSPCRQLEAVCLSPGDRDRANADGVDLCSGGLSAAGDRG